MARKLSQLAEEQLKREIQRGGTELSRPTLYMPCGCMSLLMYYVSIGSMSLLISSFFHRKVCRCNNSLYLVQEGLEQHCFWFLRKTVWVKKECK